MHDNKMLLTVKGIITVFNIPATWYVFFDMFKHTDRPEWLVYFNTFMAILAVDAVFLWVVGVLESDLSPIKRLPSAITSILMAVLVVMIGIMDEGDILAFAPRAGLLLLVFNDIISWMTDWRIMYRSREFQEQQIRDKEVIERKKVDSAAYKKALDSTKDQFEEKHRQRILSQLNLVPERSEEQPVIVTKDDPAEIKELPENVLVLEDGTIGWQSPITQEIFTETSLGKPYSSIRGAQIAASRHTKEFSSNGKH